jgi:transcription initiation factor TFIID TATA-box-binding protein
MPQTKAMVSIENVVASASISQTVDLNEITKNFVDVEYHPDQFPGLIRRMADPKTAILLLASGKLVCTGAKKESEVYRAVNNLHVLLEEKKLMVY